MIVRMYILASAPGRKADLRAALDRLVGCLCEITGFRGAELLGDTEHPDRIVFLERWESVEMHAASSSLLLKGAFEAVMATLEGKPQGFRLQPMPLRTEGLET